MPFSDSDIIAELTGGGASRLEDYFLIGQGIYAINQRGELSTLLVEDVQGEPEGALHNAMVDFLRRRNAKAYSSWEDYIQRGPNPQGEKL